ncbi:YbaB/EbfC family nucleoid-associated protein [Actinosynnema pretiosum subsp. pretiosum]|uniref:YbaB/EbfC family nucleoid-associated protein n=1 Tax=Actinosynnema pretiosum subsp. pretiosum TaxID=103721 RepID=A0AA45LAM7_9PSEU|nr:YbaB/EbfC family nucleoid-associated protein [Actinosynnema pretiosum subsp. pretiosum]
MSDPIGNSRSLVDDWERGAQERAAKYEAMREAAERISLTGSAADGAVKVTVGPNGIPSDVVMTDAVSRLRPEEIAAAVLEAMRKAQGGYAAELARIVDETVGQTAAGQHIVATAERNFPQAGAPGAPGAAVVKKRARDDGDFSGDSYLG